MTDEKQEKAISKIPKKTSVRKWTEKTGSKLANEEAWNKAVVESNKANAKMISLQKP